MTSRIIPPYPNFRPTVPLHRAVFPNLLKVAEHPTIKLLENSSYLDWNFIFWHSMLCMLNFLGSTSSLLAEHLWSPEQLLGNIGTGSQLKSFFTLYTRIRVKIVSLLNPFLDRHMPPQAQLVQPCFCSCVTNYIVILSIGWIWDNS